MPSIVAIPEYGEVTFPDSMSLEEINKASAALYENRRAPRSMQVAQPIPDAPLQVEPSFFRTPQGPDEMAARNEQGRRTFAQAVGEPQALVSPQQTVAETFTSGLPFKRLKPSAQEVQDASDYAVSWLPGRHADDPSRPPGAGAKVVAGAVGAGLSVPETMTSPLGLATFFTGGAPAWMQRLISAGFTVDMLRGAPEQVRQFKEAYEKKDVEGAVQAGGELAMTGAFIAAAGKHAAIPERTKVFQEQIKEDLAPTVAGPPTTVAREAEQPQVVAAPEVRSGGLRGRREEPSLRSRLIVPEAVKEMVPVETKEKVAEEVLGTPGAAEGKAAAPVPNPSLAEPLLKDESGTVNKVIEQTEVMPKEESSAPIEIPISTPKGNFLASVRLNYDPLSGKASIDHFKVRDPNTGSYDRIRPPQQSREFDSPKEAEQAGLEFLRQQFPASGELNAPKTEKPTAAETTAPAGTLPAASGAGAGRSDSGAGDVAVAEGAKEVVKPSGFQPPPLPEKFETLEDALKYREAQQASEMEFFKSLGLSEADARKMFKAGDSRSNLDVSNIEAKLTPENLAKLEAFSTGEGSEMYQWDRMYDPSSLQGVTDKAELASQVVANLQRESPPNEFGDKLVHAAVALRQLQKNGGTWREVAQELDKFTTRNSGSQGDKAEYFESLAKKVKAFAARQGIDLPLDERTALLPTKTPEAPRESGRVVASAQESAPQPRVAESAKYHPMVQHAIAETVTSIGQLKVGELAALNKAVKNGVLVKGKGGPFPAEKTVYAKPGYDFAGERAKAISEITKRPQQPTAEAVQAEAKMQEQVTRAADGEVMNAEIDRLTGGQRRAKPSEVARAVKSELIERLEAALKKAPDTRGPKQPKITIHIPGDGTFQIVNHKPVIEQVLKDARRLSTTAGENGITKAPRIGDVTTYRGRLDKVKEDATKIYGERAAVEKLRAQAADQELEMDANKRNNLTTAAEELEAALPENVARAQVRVLNEKITDLRESLDLAREALPKEYEKTLDLQSALEERRKAKKPEKKAFSAFYDAKQTWEQTGRDIKAKKEKLAALEKELVTAQSKVDVVEKQFPPKTEAKPELLTEESTNRSGVEGLPDEEGRNIDRTGPAGDAGGGAAERSRVVGDLQGSGKVLWGTPDEISKVFADAYRGDVAPGEPAAGGSPRQDLGRDLHPRTQEGSAGVFQQTRVFIARPAEGEAFRTGRSGSGAEVFAHRLLFNPDHQAGPDFNLRLADKLPGVKIVFMALGKEAPAQYRPDLQAVVINTDRTTGVHPAALDALLAEELLHAATRRLSSPAELTGVWRSLSPQEQTDLRRLYDPENQQPGLDESKLGSEYVRVILQQRLTGRPTEGYSTFWRATEAVKAELRKIFDFLRETFGAKPTNDMARQVIERIEGAIRGEAAIEKSVFEGGTDVERSGVDLPRDRDEAEPETKGFQVNIAGRTYEIADKVRFSPEEIAAADKAAQAKFQELGLPGAPDTTADRRAGTINNNSIWRIEPDGRNHDPAVKALREHLIEQIQKQHLPGGDIPYTTSLINAVNMNFDHGLLRQIASKPVLEALLDVTVGEASKRGSMLRMHRGISEDVRAVAQNAELRLQWQYAEALDPDGVAKGSLKRIVEGMRKYLTEAEITDLARKMVKPEEAARVIAALRKAIAGDWESLSDIMKSAHAALMDAGMTEAQASKIVSAAETILGQTIRDGANAAIAEMKAALTPDEKRGVAARALSEIQKMLLNDLFSYGDLLARLAKSERWTVPTAKEFEQIRAWAKREEVMRTPTAALIARVGGDAAAAGRFQEAATIDARKELLRKMNTQWSQWTKPLITNWRDLGDPEKVKNTNSAFNEWVAANLLLKLGFGTRQMIDVGSQTLFHTPTRALSYALESWGRDRAENRDSNLQHSIAEAMSDAYRSRAKVLLPALNAFKQTLKGKGEQRQVEQLITSIGIFERALLNASKMRSEGKRGAANLLEIITVSARMGRQFAAAMDVLHGIPAEAQEIAHQVRNALNERGLGKVATDMQFDSIMNLLVTHRAEAMSMAQDILAASGDDASKGAVERAAWHILREKVYSATEQAGMPADDWKKNNAEFRDLIGWNISETGYKGKGPGGFGGLVSLAGKKTKEMLLNVPVVGGVLSVPFTFANAMGISLNRKLAWSPLGFFPGLFKGSPYFEGETNIRQRKIEASLGTGLSAVVFTLIVGGVWKALPAFWPKDDKERDRWAKNGWTPGMVIIPWGNGQEVHLSTRVGPLAMFAPAIAAAAAYTQKQDERAKKQAALNERAKQLGVPAEKLPDMGWSDWMGVMGDAAYSAVTGGRTASGALSAYSDFGQFNIKKAGASVVTAITPGLPAVNEFGRMAGANINPKLASFWDLLVPLPTSSAQRVNLLGDPMRDENDYRRIFQILSGGNLPIPTSASASGTDTQAYAALFGSDYRPPSINPGLGRQINGRVRPFTPEELNQYTVARGQEFKKELATLGANPSTDEVKAAFQRANARALAGVGVTMPVARSSRISEPTRSKSRFRLGMSTARKSGLRSGGLRSLKGSSLRGGLRQRRKRLTMV